MNKSRERSEKVSIYLLDKKKKKPKWLKILKAGAGSGGKAMSSVVRSLIAKSNWFHITVLLSEQYSKL